MREFKPDHYELVEKIKICLEEIGITYTEVHITPLKEGYRIELYPEQSIDIIYEIANCLSNQIGLSVDVKEYVYGKVLLLKT